MHMHTHTHTHTCKHTHMQTHTHTHTHLLEDSQEYPAHCGFHGDDGCYYLAAGNEGQPGAGDRQKHHTHYNKPQDMQNYIHQCNNNTNVYMPNIPTILINHKKHVHIQGQETTYTNGHHVYMPDIHKVLIYNNTNIL